MNGAINMAGLSLPIKFGFGLHFVTSRSLNLNAITFSHGRDVIFQAYFKTFFDELLNFPRQESPFNCFVLRRNLISFH